MNTPNNPGELKKMWTENSVTDIALFFGAVILVLAIANAIGIFVAQKLSN